MYSGRAETGSSVVVNSTDRITLCGTGRSITTYMVSRPPTIGLIRFRLVFCTCVRLPGYSSVGIELNVVSTDKYSNGNSLPNRVNK